MCQYKKHRRKEVVKIQRIYAKHFNINIKKINICINFLHVLYNSLQYSKDLFDKFTKTITMWSSTCGFQTNPASKNFCFGFDTNLSLRAKFQDKKQALT